MVVPVHSDAFAEKLLSWFGANRRAMPWRETKDPYMIWLSEVMLQQTQVDTVIPYYQRFIEVFPDPESLSKAPEDDVLKLWEGLGYYRRCHHFIAAVRDVCADYGGRIPDDPHIFRRLPGVGDYTTAAVMSIAYGHVLPVVDGNVIRVITRIYRIADDTTKTKTRMLIRDMMAALIPSDSPGDFNQAVMELGALVCTPKKPLCGECPLNDLCRAFQHRDISLYPFSPKKMKIPQYPVGLALIMKDGRFLIQKRPSKGHLAGLWELPGGKAEGDESAETAMLRKCREELGLTVEVCGMAAQASHVYSHFKIHVSVFSCTVGAQREKDLKHQPFMWITPSDIPSYAFPAVNLKLFQTIFPSVM